MGSPEASPGKEIDPRLVPILEQYGEVQVVNHEGRPQPLSQAVDECPPFAAALLNAGGPEQLEQIINALRVPE